MHRRPNSPADERVSEPAELADLGALLDSVPDGQTQEIRRILAGRQFERLTGQNR